MQMLVMNVVLLAIAHAHRARLALRGEDDLRHRRAVASQSTSSRGSSPTSPPTTCCSRRCTAARSRASASAWCSRRAATLAAPTSSRSCSSRKVSLGVGQLMLLADAVVIVIAGLVFGRQFALYAVVAIFVSGQTVDIVQEGLAVEKAAFIISDASGPIGEAITGELGRGATAIAATGVYTGEPRGMLFVVVSRRSSTTSRRSWARSTPRRSSSSPTCTRPSAKGSRRCGCRGGSGSGELRASAPVQQARLSRASASGTSARPSTGRTRRPRPPRTRARSRR